MTRRCGGELTDMAEILKISAGEEPFTNTNYVVVEQTKAGAFRASGKASRGGALDYFAPPQMRDLAVMLRVAATWADEQGIHFVHVRMQVAH